MSLFGREYTCAEILAGGYTGYDYLSVQTNRSGCVESVTLEVLITPEEVYEGRCYDGLTDFTYTMTAAGESTKEFGLVIPLGNLELIDINGYRVYPVHLHTWSFSRPSDYELTATCVSDPVYELGCPFGKPVSLTLGTAQGAFDYTGEPVTMEIGNLEDFRWTTGALVSDVIYLDGEGEVLAGPPSQPGRYTARVRIIPMGGDVHHFERIFTIRGGVANLMELSAFTSWMCSRGLTEKALVGGVGLSAGLRRRTGMQTEPNRCACEDE